MSNPLAGTVVSQGSIAGDLPRSKSRSAVLLAAAALFCKNVAAHRLAGDGTDIIYVGM